MSTPSLPPAGWYTDPHGIAERRWWDGGHWTEHIHPAPATTPPVEPAIAVPVQSGSEPEPGLEPLAPTNRAAPAEKYPVSWSAGKREKRAREAKRWLLPGESTIFQFSANSTRPLTTEVVVTDMRVFTYGAGTFGREVLNSDVVSVDLARSSIVVTTVDDDIVKLSAIDAKDREAALAAIRNATALTPSAEALTELERRASVKAEAQALADADEAARAARWEDSTVLGPVRGKSYRSIARLSHGDEVPWLVMGSWGAGVLAAFEDRLVIVKTGAMTSLMAGSLGGERATTFYFTDITVIEFNSGFMTGVLEILTPSYQGTANKDFWRGTTKSRNADSNDPYTLSNTLPMSKAEYIQYTPHIQELRAKVAAAKRPVSVPVVAQATPSLADELAKLAALRDAGVLSDEEFAAAKSQLITRGGAN
ncbi:UNVERIFIED_CONTAM: DUF2510 domain-containing protein [Microbacterium sp. SLM126]